MQQPQEDQQGRNQELIQLFTEIVKQQSLHTNLLVYQQKQFEQLKKLIKDQQQKLKSYLAYEDEDEDKPQNKNFKYIIYSSEIQKLQYLLKMYLRTRLKKIQLYSFHFIKNQLEAEKIMSPPELKFLKKYAEQRFEYYKDHVFKHLVKNYRDFKTIETVYAKNEAEAREKKIYVDTKQSVIDLMVPNQHQYVFAEILNNPLQMKFGIEFIVSNVPSDQIEVVSQGTVLFCPLKMIKDRLQPHNYRLI